MVTKTTGDPALSELVDRFAKMGAPWITGIRNIRTLAKRLKLELLENVSTAELHRIHWPERPIDTGFFCFYSVCTLAN